MNGFINILKPSGMNSNFAVVGVRRLLEKGVKVGHMGTLDPAAAGVLPIGIGFGARLFDYVIDKEKEYICEATFGVRTDTQDAQGKIVTKTDASVGADDVLAVLPQFTGDIMQTPPAYSAVVKDGRKLYSIARSGGDATVPQRAAHVEAIELLDNPGANRFLLRIICGRGTYVRTICSDIGDVIGCGAYCSFLLRSRAGCFDLGNALRFDELSPEFIREKLLPVDLPIAHMPLVRATAEMRSVIRNGGQLPLERYEGGLLLSGEEPARVYLEDEFVGIGCGRQGMLRFLSLRPAGEM